MSEFFFDWWFVIIPGALGLFWFAAALLIWRATSEPMAAAARADGLEPEYDDLRDWEMNSPWRWRRVFEVCMIAYHFPVIIPTTLISKDDEGPRLWILVPLQAAVYAAILWGISLLF